MYFHLFYGPHSTVYKVKAGGDTQLPNGHGKLGVVFCYNVHATWCHFDQ